MTTLLCPGQGTQRVGMGKDLAERFPRARETFETIDDALGVPLSHIMWEGPVEELTQTHNAQPAILAHSVAVHAVVADRLTDVAVAAGHSLGEYSAYVMAGALTPAEGARLVRRRGELMAEAGGARPGSMAAVIGLDSAAVESACADASTDREVAVAANLNAPDQTVISGDPAAVERASAACKDRGAKRVLPLKVSGAFHSPLMGSAVAGLRQALGAVAFGTPRFPVIANADAEPVRDAGRATEMLERQLTAPVRWVETMAAAARLAPDTTYLELGPGTVLSGLAKRILLEPPTVSLGTAEDVERFLG